jgi:hypothetical protein
LNERFGKGYSHHSHRLLTGGVFLMTTPPAKPQTIGPQLLGTHGPERPPTKPIGPQLPGIQNVAIGPIGPERPTETSGPPQLPIQTVPIGPQRPTKEPKKSQYGPQRPEIDQFGHIAPLINGPHIGPMPLPTDFPKHLLERKEEMEMHELINSRAKKPVQTQDSNREEWMLVPPESLRAGMGLGKSRGFRRLGVEDVDSSAWTASPLEKTRDQKKRQINDNWTDQDARKRQIVEQHNQAMRPTSLLDQHLKGAAADKETDPFAQRFNRERDIVAKTFSPKSAQETIRGAKELNSKFTSGKKSFL